MTNGPSMEKVIKFHLICNIIIGKISHFYLRLEHV